MPVCRQHVGQLSVTQDGHRETVGEAVSFVRTGFVQRKAFDEGTSALWKNHDLRIAQNRFYGSYCGPSNARIFFGQRVQELDKDRVGGQNPGASEGRRTLDGDIMMLIEWIGEGDPISGVSKDMPQDRRLPYR